VRVFGRHLKKKCAKATGVDPNKVKAHALKHFITTHVLDAGANLAVVKDWLRHADIRHTTIYA